MKILRLAAGVLLLASALFFSGLLPIAAAFAQTVIEKSDTTVEIPIGEWIKAIGEFVMPLVVLAFGWLCRKLPGQLASILATMRVDQLLEKAIGYAINATAGAMKGKPLSIDVGSEVVEKALQYVVDNGPVVLINWMGGVDGIKQKIIARIDLDPSASISPHDPTVIK
jgi:hypothetical protein